MKIAPSLARFVFVGLLGTAAGREIRPNEVDRHTLHLWHLDESTPPFADAVPGGTPLLGLCNGATAGEPGLPGLGRAVSFNHIAGGTPGESSLAGGILTAAPQPAIGPADNVPGNFRFQGDDGAFTFEAVLRFDLFPEEVESIALGILTMDGENEDRIFNFRIEREGILSFVPLPDSSSSGGALATIPRSGPHAINKDDWFHVAVRYDGREGVAENLQLFWTNLAVGGASAHRIGAGMLDRDLAPRVGDFAIGNEARSFEPGNAEAEPFPGFIDEVRISSVARNPSDFLFVPPEERTETRAGSPLEADPSRTGPFRLEVAGLVVDGKSIPALADAGAPVSLKPGLHRLDFDVAILAGASGRPADVRCQLEGLDERWQGTAAGMGLVFQFLDSRKRPISQAQFHAVGTSPRWGSRLADSGLNARREPIYNPTNAAFVRVTLHSGSPVTTGRIGIDNLRLYDPAQPSIPLWSNSGFELGLDFESPTRSPAGWERAGEEPAIAQVTLQGDSALLCLVDGDQSQAGEWTAIQPLDPDAVGGRTLIAEWDECYSIIAGSQQRATYLNVPPGHYTFRAIGMTDAEPPVTADTSLPLGVRAHLWKRGWFWPLISAGIVAVIGAWIIRYRNHRNRLRMRELAFQTALERDRTRIARDMHDDLGTRITVLNLTASLASQAIGRDPDKARRQLDKMTHAARELVVAMDDLVWTVDPSHDNLDDLASQLTRHAEEIFHDSPVRCRLDIPSSLPPQPIRSEFRHNISMAVREALNNILKHAGPCEATLRLRFDGSELSIDIQDSGRGFDSSQDGDGHGLGNFEGRLADVGGRCEIVSSPGAGTRVSFHCPVPADIHSPLS